ncbi:hypothetical protein Tco_0064897, partial [Tanacetum coccineum]
NLEIDGIAIMAMYLVTRVDSGGEEKPVINRVAIATPAVAEAEPKEEVVPKRPPAGPKGKTKVFKSYMISFCHVGDASI